MDYHQAFVLSVCKTHSQTVSSCKWQTTQFLLNSVSLSTSIQCNKHGMNHNSPVLLLVAEKKEIVSEHVSLEVNKKF